MNPEIATEARLLLLGMLTGGGLLLVYDILRAFRKVIRHSWFWIGIEDLVYWIFSGFATFYLLYRENDGALRIYVIGTVLLSMLVYDRIMNAILKRVEKGRGMH